MKPNKELSNFKKELRKVVADYIHSEGCGCCSNADAHEEASQRLGKLLNIKKYDDGSGYDFSKYRSK